MEKALIEQGIKLISGATYERVEQDGNIKKVHIIVNGKNKVIESDELLVGTGRKPNTEVLNLSAAGVQVGPNNEIKINAFAQTSNRKIYAAGDVTLGPQFVYVAAYEGGIAAGNAIGGLNRFIGSSWSIIYQSAICNCWVNTTTSERKRIRSKKSGIVIRKCS